LTECLIYKFIMQISPSLTKSKIPLCGEKGWDEFVDFELSFELSLISPLQGRDLF